MPDKISTDQLPVPGYAGYMPLPWWSDEDELIALEPGVNALYLKLFVGISLAIFAVLAGLLLLLGTVEETFREHRMNLLYLFLLVSPAVGFFLATLVNRVLGAFWGAIYIDGEAGIVVKRRWNDSFRIPLERVEAVQLCTEPEGRAQLNLLERTAGAARERRFLFHHTNRAYLRELGERLARHCRLEFLESC